MSRSSFQLVFAVFATLAAVDALAADVLLREQLTPTGPVVRLGDVAEITRATPDEAARLLAMPLMPAPAPGTSQVVRGQQIRELLTAMGVDLAELRFGGATRVAIGREWPRQPASTDQPSVDATPETTTPVASAAPREDRAALSSAPSTTSLPPTTAATRRRQSTGFRVPPSAAPTESAVPKPRYSRRSRTQTISAAKSRELEQRVANAINRYAFNQTGDPMLRATGIELPPRRLASVDSATTALSATTTEPIGDGEQRFLISFSNALGEVRFPVFAELRQATPQVVAAAEIARGATLTAANTRIVPATDEFRLRSGETAYTSLEEVIGKETKLLLREGQPLTDANCLPPLMVRRGELVDVVSGGGGLQVRMKAKAKRDGRLGELIVVETPDGERSLEARVVGHGELAVLSASNRDASYVGSVPRSRSLR